jgi:hypothetical protein
MGKSPKCFECESHSSGYGRIPYHLCKKAFKPMKLGEIKTSPKWCPKRKEADHEND